jgi:tRNA(Met) cytidine acetyltransferase
MAFGVLRLARLWLEGLRSAWFRGLMLLHTATLPQHASTVAGLLSSVYGEVLCVAPREFRGGLEGYCGRVVSPSAIAEILGTENDAVLIVTAGLLRPNLLAAAAETVRGGGCVALLVPPLDRWQPGGGMSTGHYRRYLLARLESLKSLFWADLSLDTVYAARLPAGEAVQAEGPEGYRARSPVHRKLVEACLTREQAEALDKIVGHLRSRGRSVLVLGDRGRGKSGLLGLAVAYIVASHMAGFIPVTAPTPYGVQSFFRVLLRALRLLGVRSWSIERHGVMVGVAGPWFHVRYHTPDRVEPGSFTVVDEAAALGPLRLRSIARRAPRLLAATTIHGYEGSGRVMARLAAELLREPRLVVELERPVRYAVNDPLERWLYETFMLRTVEPEKPASLSEARVRLVDRDEMVGDVELLGKLYSILVAAHYRNEPDDLALMLDAPHHRVYALFAGDTPVAVAQVAVEGPELPREARILPDILAQYSHEAGRLRGWRIVRIAVHPELQRRGLGSRLLAHVEGEAAREGFEWVGAIFGRPDVLGFWLKNGYHVVYISPLPNRLTGENNIAVVKAVGERSGGLVAGVALAARRRLLLALHNLYRGLPAEAVYQILRVKLEPSEPLAELDGPQLHRVKLFLNDVLDVESILDIVWLKAVNETLAGGRLPLEGEEAIALIMRALQGKTAGEIAAALEADVGRVRELLREAALKLLSGGQDAG